jgi:hypothetical protein
MSTAFELKVSPQLPLILMMGTWQKQNDLLVLLWFMTVLGRDVQINTPGWINARHEWIAEDVGINVRAVSKSIAALLDIKLIEQVAPRELSYRLNLDLIVKGDAVRIREMFDDKEQRQFVTIPKMATRSKNRATVAQGREKRAARIRRRVPAEVLAARPGRGAHLRAGSPLRAAPRRGQPPGSVEPVRFPGLFRFPPQPTSPKPTTA